ncbi:MAG: SH3 domain-containing protein [Anaerolineae bacterium]|nr:SH3 domain-containing protein [Anaerolineae bacterium]
MLRKLTVTFVFAALMIAALFTTWGITAVDAAQAPYQTRLAVGEYAQVIPPDPSNVRTSAGRWLGSVPARGVVYILDGPLYRSNMIWWYIDYPETGLQGWMSEGGRRGYYMAPWDGGIGGSDTPTSTTGLAVGDLAYVIEPPDNIVRRNPGLNSAVIGRFPAGAVLDIVGGPRTADGIIWWKVYSRSQNLSGWTAEGLNGTDYLAHIIGVPRCANSLRSILDGQDRAYVMTTTPDANLLRGYPDTSARIIGRMQPGETMTIVDGPFCDVNENIVWWEVVPDSNPRLHGWTAESEDFEYYLAPLTLY